MKTDSISQMARVFLAAGIWLLCSALPVLGESCDISVTDEGITGNAQQIPLSNALSQLASKAGYTILVDKNIQFVPVTFRMNSRMTPEKAIQRIVHPYNYAIVYGAGERKGEYTVIEIRVYGEKAGQSLEYATITSRSTALLEAERKGTGDSDNEKSAVGLAVKAAAPDAGRSIAGKQLVKQNFITQKNAFGQPVIGKRSPFLGPDYRPTTAQLRNAYQRYQATKKFQQQRAAQSAKMSAKRKYEQQKSKALEKQNAKPNTSAIHAKDGMDINTSTN